MSKATLAACPGRADAPAPVGHVIDAVRNYVAASTLSQALATLAQGNTIVLAGGTDLMPQDHAGRVRPADTLLNIRRVGELRGITVEAVHLVLGALTTVTELLTDPLVRRHAPLLTEAADHFASDQVRNMATLGGNLCNASPASDMAPALLALDAEVALASLATDGSIAVRWLPLDGFFTAPGKTLREAHELLSAVRLPLPATGQFSRLHKAGVRPALDIATIAIALSAQRDADGSLHTVRLALGAVGPTPMRARAAEALLEGKLPEKALIAAAAQAAADAARPIDDVRASAWYRRELVHNMTRRMLEDVTNT